MKRSAEYPSLSGIGTFNALGTFAVDGDLTAWGGMANVWYDIKTGTSFVPFIGGGIGFQHLNLDVNSIGGAAAPYNASDTVFAYQLGGGLSYMFTPRVRAMLSYRFLGTADPEFKDNGETIEGSYHSYNILGGILVGF